MDQNDRLKHKPTNVGRIALERQAGQFNSDQFFFKGAKKPLHRGDSNHGPPDPEPHTLTTALQVTYLLQPILY